MQVTFFKLVEQRCSYWEALRGSRTKVPGTPMALGRGEMPHDLSQLVVEAALRLSFGFWGCVAAGATFKSTGRKRTKPGRAVIAQHRKELLEAENAAGREVTRWKAGIESPVSRELNRIGQLWDALSEHDALVIHWPSLRAEVRYAMSPEKSRGSPLPR